MSRIFFSSSLLSFRTSIFTLLLYRLVHYASIQWNVVENSSIILCEIMCTFSLCFLRFNSHNHFDIERCILATVCKPYYTPSHKIFVSNAKSYSIFFNRFHREQEVKKKTYFTVLKAIFGFHHFTSPFDEFTTLSWLLNVHLFIVHLLFWASLMLVRRAFTCRPTYIPYFDIRIFIVIYTIFTVSWKYTIFFSSLHHHCWRLSITELVLSHHQVKFYQCLRSCNQIPLSVKINIVHNFQLNMNLKRNIYLPTHWRMNSSQT